MKMLTKEKQAQLQALVHNATKEELAWVNGYLSGLLGEGLLTTSPNLAVGVPQKLTIAYGTETGNSKKLATDLVTIAKQKKLLTKLVSLDQYRLSDLVKEEYFVTVISTQGEGDPPPAAQKFYDHIHQNGFQLPQLKFSVLALGDTSYPLFCKAGEDVDSQLEKLGGKRIVPIQKCDLDYQADAERWFHNCFRSGVSGWSIKPC
jgi:sulfite reductase (NADPH) flavoprotein alpha-component